MIIFSRLRAMSVANPENFVEGWGDKIYKLKLCIISKFRMFMINVLDFAQTCLAFSLIRRISRNLKWRAVTGVWGRTPQPPEAIGGLREESPAVEGTEVWGRSPQRSKYL